MLLNDVLNKSRLLHKSQKNAKSYKTRHSKRILTMTFDNNKNGQPQEKYEKRPSEYTSIKYKSCKFCDGFWKNMLIFQQTSAFATNATSWANLQKLVY